MSVRNTVARWDQDPLIKLVGLVASTTLPVCAAAVGLTWKLSAEAESIRNKIDHVTSEHAKLEARVNDINRSHEDLRVKVASCCKNTAQLGGWHGWASNR